MIHFESAFKIDLFLRKDTAFERDLLVRRQYLKLSDADFRLRVHPQTRPVSL